MSALRARALACALLALAAAATPVPAQPPVPRFLAFEAALEGEGEGELRWPVAVAAGAALEIAIADAYGPRLVVFTAAGLGWTTERVVPLDAAPLAVVHDGGRYVVALRGRGELLTLEGPGAEPGRLPLPGGSVPGALAATPGGGLLVYDAAASRVLALDAAGRTTGEVAVSGHVTALAAAADGGFYAAVAEEARVVRYGANGRAVSDWRVPGDDPVPAWPDGLVAAPGGRLLLADRHNGRVLALDGAGRLAGVGSGKGWERGRLLHPAGMTRLSDGRLAVADRGNGRVQIFRGLAPAADPRTSPGGSSP